MDAGNEEQEHVVPPCPGKLHSKGGDRLFFYSGDPEKYTMCEECFRRYVAPYGEALTSQFVVRQFKDIPVNCDFKTVHERYPTLMRLRVSELTRGNEGLTPSVKAKTLFGDAKNPTVTTVSARNCAEFRVYFEQPFPDGCDAKVRVMVQGVLKSRGVSYVLNPATSLWGVGLDNELERARGFHLRTPSTMTAGEREAMCTAQLLTEDIWRAWMVSPGDELQFTAQAQALHFVDPPSRVVGGARVRRANESSKAWSDIGPSQDFVVKFETTYNDSDHLPRFVMWKEAAATLNRHGVNQMFKDCHEMFSRAERASSALHHKYESLVRIFDAKFKNDGLDIPPEYIVELNNLASKRVLVEFPEIEQPSAKIQKTGDAV